MGIEMELRDVFVATVAIVLGGIMLYAAILDRGWCFQLKITRIIADAQGRTKARQFIGFTGTSLIVMGIYIVFAPQIAKAFVPAGIDQGNRDSGTVNSADVD